MRWSYSSLVTPNGSFQRGGRCSSRVSVSSRAALYPSAYAQAASSSHTYSMPTSFSPAGNCCDASYAAHAHSRTWLRSSLRISVGSIDELPSYLREALRDQRAARTVAVWIERARDVTCDPAILGTVDCFDSRLSLAEPIGSAAATYTGLWGCDCHQGN